jgi:hypothetical protein
VSKLAFSIHGWNRNPLNDGLVEKVGLLFHQVSYSESDTLKDVSDGEICMKQTSETMTEFKLQRTHLKILRNPD